MLCIKDSLDRIIDIYRHTVHPLLEFDKVQLTLFPMSLVAACVIGTRSIQPNSKN